MVEQQELKTCPFCGGEAEVWVSDVTDRAIVYCKDCDAQIRIRPNEKEAIEAWNKRVGEVDWFRSLPTKDKENLFKYISEKCQKCGELR
jgi:Lar family restriction alleviation protein